MNLQERRGKNPTRPKPSKRSYDRVLIVCEDKKSAYYYLTALLECYEVWLMLHFEKYNRPGEGSEALERRLSSLVSGGYQKNDSRIFAKVTCNGGLEIAKNNAEWLERQNEASASITPATKMHYLVRNLERIKNS